ALNRYIRTLDVGVSGKIDNVNCSQSNIDLRNRKLDGIGSVTSRSLIRSALRISSRVLIGVLDGFIKRARSSPGNDIISGFNRNRRRMERRSETDKNENQQ